MKHDPFLTRTPRLASAVGCARSSTDSVLAAEVSERWLAQLRPFFPPGAATVISLESGFEDSVIVENSSRGQTRMHEAWTEYVWVRNPGRARVEYFDSRGRESIAVFGDTTWAEWTPERGLTSGSMPVDAKHREHALLHHEVVLALLQPRRLIHGYSLQRLGVTEVLGRRAIRFKGVPTYDAESVYVSGGENEPTVFPGADETEFVADADRGVLLRWAGYVAGEQYDATNFMSIEFDRSLDEDLFNPTSAIAWRGLRNDHH